MKDFLRQNGILLLIAAVLISVVLWLGSALMGGTDPVSNLAGAVVTPLRGGVTAALNWFRDVQEYVLHYDELHAELDALRQEILRGQRQELPGDEALETARRLAREEGLMCGISSGTNVAAAIKLAKKLGPGKTVVTVLPDTAERYFSTPLFEGDR